MGDFDLQIRELEKRIDLQIEELRERVRGHEGKIDYLVKSVEQLLATSSDRRDSQRIIVLIVLTLLSLVFQVAIAAIKR